MQKILVVQRDGLGEPKVSVVTAQLPDLELRSLDLTGPFAELLDEPGDEFPDELEAQLAWAELVLDHLYHPDLSDHLVQRCAAHQVPLIAAGRKLAGRADTPTTCCTLWRSARFGEYGERFGAPELEAEVVEGRLRALAVRRGAPCGATWHAAAAVTGMSVEEALSAIGLHTQFHCLAKANPNVFLTNPLHVAGEVHIAALKKALGDEALDPSGRDG